MLKSFKHKCITALIIILNMFVKAIHGSFAFMLRVGERYDMLYLSLSNSILGSEKLNRNIAQVVPRVYTGSTPGWVRRSEEYRPFSTILKFITSLIRDLPISRSLSLTMPVPLTATSVSKYGCSRFFYMYVW